MSYKINKTDGTLLVDLVDGKIDSDSIDVTLIGRNTTSYGEVMNENFVKILENFANAAEPDNPLRGQIWYDTSDGRLKVFDGTRFRNTDTTVLGASQPTMLAGDIWIDSANQQMYFSDGVDVILAGPTYTSTQGYTGVEPVTLVDRFGQRKTVTIYKIGNQPAMLISREAFTAASTTDNLTKLTGFTTAIKSGITIATALSDFSFYGNADSTTKLSDGTTTFVPNDFLIKASASTQEVSARLQVTNIEGLKVGPNLEILLKAETNKVVLRSTSNTDDLALQVTRSNVATDAIFIDNDVFRLGFKTSTPEYDFDFAGDMRVTGDLTVQGDTTYISTQTLQLEDHQIELAVADDSSTYPDSAAIDDAGIVIRGGPEGYESNTKSWTWKNATDAWTPHAYIDLPSGYHYKIGGSEVLSSTALATSVTSALGITQIGTLTELTVDNFTFNSSTLTMATPLTLTIGGDITFTNENKLLNVGTPDVSDDPNTAATKEYVDNASLERDEAFSLDTTGLTDVQIADVIEDLFPAITKNPGVYCKVHCTSYSGTYAYDAGDGLTKSFVTVDKNGVENQSVLQDVAFAEQTNQTVTLTVTRTLKRFVVNGAQQWEFDTDL